MSKFYFEKDCIFPSANPHYLRALGKPFSLSDHCENY